MPRYPITAAIILHAEMNQQALSDYEMSSEEAFWLSQVAEDGTLPTPADQKLASKLRNHGLVDVYEKPRSHRDPALEQVYFVTDRGDAAIRSYQAYRARWA